MNRKVFEKLYELRAESDKRGEELKDLIKNEQDTFYSYAPADIYKAQALEYERHAKALRELLDVMWGSVDE